MKYPYIGKVKDGQPALFASPMDAVLLGTSGSYTDGWNEISFKNITHEYLANTYGEVQSPEHAELIIALAKNENAIISTTWNRGKYFNFYTSSSGELHLDFYDKELASDSEERLITIPLPPKADKQELSDWPQVGDKAFLSGCSVVVLCLHEGLAWCRYAENKNSTITVKATNLVKPKTPEEELRELLNELWDENAGDFDDFVDIAIRHVIKKPQ